MKYFNVVYYKTWTYHYMFGYGDDDEETFEIYDYILQASDLEMVNKWCELNPLLHKSSKKHLKKLDNDYVEKGLTKCKDKIYTYSNNEIYRNGNTSKTQYFYIVYKMDYSDPPSDNKKWKNIVHLSKEYIDNKVEPENKKFIETSQKYEEDISDLSEKVKAIEEEIKCIKRKRNDIEKAVCKKFIMSA